MFYVHNALRPRVQSFLPSFPFLVPFSFTFAATVQPSSSPYIPLHSSLCVCFFFTPCSLPFPFSMSLVYCVMIASLLRSSSRLDLPCRIPFCPVKSHHCLRAFLLLNILASHYTFFFSSFALFFLFFYIVSLPSPSPASFSCPHSAFRLHLYLAPHSLLSSLYLSLSVPLTQLKASLYP